MIVQNNLYEKYANAARVAPGATRQKKQTKILRNGGKGKIKKMIKRRRYLEHSKISLALWRNDSSESGRLYTTTRTTWGNRNKPIYASTHRPSIRRRYYCSKTRCRCTEQTACRESRVVPNQYRIYNIRYSYYIGKMRKNRWKVKTLTSERAICMKNIWTYLKQRKKIVMNL